MTKIQVYALTEEEKENVRQSDEYGFKKMLQEVIEKDTCPVCQKVKGKLGFFVWEDESKGLAVCVSCGYKKQFATNKSNSSKTGE